jgi:hypothetical protein
VSIDPENPATGYLSLPAEVAVDAGSTVMSGFDWGPTSDHGSGSHDEGSERRDHGSKPREGFESRGEGSEANTDHPETDAGRPDGGSEPHDGDGSDGGHGSPEEPEPHEEPEPQEEPETPDGGTTSGGGSGSDPFSGTAEHGDDGDRTTAAADPADIDELRAVVNGLGETTEQLGAAVESMRSELETLDARVDEDVEDLRERLVRIYRDAEGKAPADHSHPETTDRIDGLADDHGDLAERVDAVESAVDGVEAVADRIADVESRVDDLVGTADDVSGKLSRVASAVVRTQRRLRTMEHERAHRDRLDEILAAANRHGVGKAACTGCGNTVRLSLLSRPECPYCEGRFDELEPAERFYRTSRLRVDDRPALEGDVSANGDTGWLDEPDRPGGADRDDDNPAGRDVSTREDGATASTGEAEATGSGDSTGDPGRTDPEERDGS